MREIERNIAAAIIESSDGFLLFGKSTKGGVYQGCWIIPGGGIDEGETREEALHREVMEETGIDLTQSKVTLINDRRTGTVIKTLKDTGEEVKVAMNFNDYHAVLFTDKAATIFSANDDIAELRWFGKDELAELNLAAPTIELLKDLGYL